MAHASLTVKEASDAYANAMRNPAARQQGVCPICWTFHDPAYETCIACDRQPDHLDVVVPITYSVHMGQMHDALRGYKDDSRREVCRYHSVRLTAILWRFLEDHEYCIAAAAGEEQFDLVATVPSKSRDRDEERPRRHDGPTVTPTAAQRAAERELQSQAELAYRRLVGPISFVVGRTPDEHCP